MTTCRSLGETIPKVRMPKKGWPRLPKRRIFRRLIRRTGLPPCPECHSFKMEKDERKNELYCTECGHTA